MPSMLRMTSYDTICHEHLGIYCARRNRRISWRPPGTKVVDVTMNAVNGGSFAVTAANLLAARAESCQS